MQRACVNVRKCESNDKKCKHSTVLVCVRGSSGMMWAAHGSNRTCVDLIRSMCPIRCHRAKEVWSKLDCARLSEDGDGFNHVTVTKRWWIQPGQTHCLQPHHCFKKMVDARGQTHCSQPHHCYKTVVDARTCQTPGLFRCTLKTCTSATH